MGMQIERDIQSEKYQGQKEMDLAMLIIMRGYMIKYSLLDYDKKEKKRKRVGYLFRLKIDSKVNSQIDIR